MPRCRGRSTPPADAEPGTRVVQPLLAGGACDTGDRHRFEVLGALAVLWRCSGSALSVSCGTTFTCSLAVCSRSWAPPLRGPAHQQGTAVAPPLLPRPATCAQPPNSHVALPWTRVGSHPCVGPRDAACASGSERHVASSPCTTHKHMRSAEQGAWRPGREGPTTSASCSGLAVVWAFGLVRDKGTGAFG